MTSSNQIRQSQESDSCELISAPPTVRFSLNLSMSRSPASIRAQLFHSDYICQSCRANPLPPRTSRSFLQKRWIGMNQIRRIKEAQDHWAAQAEDVMQGKKQSMLGLLEERGYVNQIVGSAPIVFQREMLVLTTWQGNEMNWTRS